MFFTEEERRLTIEGCRFCPMCYHADTAAAITCKESNSPRGRGLILYALDQGVLKWEDPMVADVFYKSFTDGLPKEWCAGHYDHDELVIDTRHRLIEKGLAPPEVTRVIDRVLETGTPYAEETGTPKDFLKEAGLKATRGADLLVFFGCTVRSQAPSSARSFLKILKATGNPFNIVDPEICCGMPLYLFGDFNSAILQAKRVNGEILSRGAKEIVFLDAECYRMFSNRYTRLGAPIPEGRKILHVSDWILREIKEGRLTPQRRNGKATYHDPCSLARFTDTCEAPREILTRTLVGDLIEMQSNRLKAYCCGGGGGMPFTYPEIAHAAAVRRYGHAVATQAEILITGSPSCSVQLSAAKRPDGPAVMDLVEWVAAAL